MPDDSPLLLDVTRLIWRRWRGRRPTGIDRVALAYLRHFGPRAQAVVQHRRFRRILDERASRQLFALLEEPGERFKPALILGAIGNLARLNGAGRGRFYLNVGHTGLDSQGFRNWVAAADVRPIYLVHDLIPITHPQFCRGLEDERHRARILTVLRSGAGVIANSRTTLAELSAFAASQELKIPPSLVAWLGCDPLPLAEAKPAARPRFIALGTIEGRKNHMLLLNIWSRLVHRLGNAAPQLYIIGQRGWSAEDVFEILDASETLRGHVIELNHCSDEDLAYHLASARALLFPSLVEGYGLPLIEALGSGVPAIASDLPAFREVAGEIPTYVSPTDEAAWEAVILDYAQPTSETRAAQLTRIEAFKTPDWPAHFDAVEAWLTELASSQGAPTSI